MSLLVVGSVAYDTIETPFEKHDLTLGGSATHFSLAARLFHPVRLVGVVGTDFRDDYKQRLAERDVCLEGLETADGKTFYWWGKYHEHFVTRETIEVDLNTLGTFDPKVPESYRDTKVVFLANTTPATQGAVLDQLKGPELVVADTMDLWIQTTRADLMSLLKRVDALVLNDEEARMLTDIHPLVEAAHAIRAMGPRFVIIKKGEHGAMLVDEEGVFLVPAYPTSTVADPTGAGDSFAGGMMGYLTETGDFSLTSLKRAMAYGTVVASMNVEGVGAAVVTDQTRAKVDARMSEFESMVQF